MHRLQVGQHLRTPSHRPMHCRWYLWAHGVVTTISPARKGRRHTYGVRGSAKRGSARRVARARTLMHEPAAHRAFELFGRIARQCLTGKIAQDHLDLVLRWSLGAGMSAA